MLLSGKSKMKILRRRLPRRPCCRPIYRWTACRTDSSFRSWLHGIVRHVCMSHLRDRGRMRGPLNRWVAMLAVACLTAVALAKEAAKAGDQGGLSAGEKGHREDAVLLVAHKWKVALTRVFEFSLREGTASLPKPWYPAFPTVLAARAQSRSGSKQTFSQADRGWRRMFSVLNFASWHIGPCHILIGAGVPLGASDRRTRKDRD